jgi:hypothetical protein
MHVIGNRRPAGADRSRCSLELETQIAFGVNAVVDEEIYLTEVFEKTREQMSARALEILPASATRLGDGRRRLIPQSPLDQRWEIDAPELSAPVSLERFEQKARRDAPCNARLDHFRRP